MQTELNKQTEIQFLEELSKHITGDILFGDNERKVRHYSKLAAKITERLDELQAQEWRDEYYAQCECGKWLQREYVEKHGGFCGECERCLS